MGPEVPLLLLGVAVALAGACGGSPQPAVRSPGTQAPGAESDVTATAAASATTLGGAGSVRRTTPFVPLDNPAFIAAADASYLTDQNLVLGFDLMGEARAYPVRMVYYHHIVNDTVAGRPVLVTY